MPKKYDVFISFDFQDLLETDLSVKQIRDLIEGNPIEAVEILFGEDVWQKLSLSEVAIEES